MKKLSILLALVSILLTGCDKEPTPAPQSGQSLEQLLESVQGNWEGVFKSDNGSSSPDYSFDIGNEIVPAVVIEGNHYIVAHIPLSGDCILKGKNVYELTLTEDGKLACTLDSPVRGEITCTFELQGNKLTVVKNYDADDVSVTWMMIRSDLPVKNAPVDLSQSGTANCYIVSEPGEYFFWANVKGNGNPAAIAGSTSPEIEGIVSAEMYRESYPTKEAWPDFVPNMVLKDVKFEDGVISFSTAEPFSKGNVIIAAKNAADEILWSWHIWVTDQPEELVYANNAGIMMDRNLGAWETTKEDDKLNYTYGYLYQWGRKDPLKHTNLGLAFMAENYQIGANFEDLGNISDVMDYSIKNPDKFIRTGLDVGLPGWYTSGDQSKDRLLWSSEKTIYDPCPPGWRVPSHRIWTDAGFVNTDSDDSEDEGYMMPASICGKDSWYPSSYCIGADGEFCWNGVYLTVDFSDVPGSNDVKVLSITTRGDYDVMTTIFQTAPNGCFVRCQKIQ